MTSSRGVASRSAFVAWARTAAISLRSAELKGNNSDLVPLRNMIGSARVMALGEPAHGAHEPLAFRNRLFAHLVKHGGFTAIALETSFTESEEVERYVIGGAGNPCKIVEQSFSWAFGSYAENVALVQWMRAYNRHATRANKIHFFGIDVSGGCRSEAGSFSHPGVVVDAVTSYIKSTVPSLSREMLSRVEPVLRRMSRKGWQQFVMNHGPEFCTILNSLGRFLSRQSAALRRASSRSQYEWALHNITVGGQLTRLPCLESLPESSSTRANSTTLQRARVRDSAMAENVMWALRQIGPRGRLLVFAHNVHVMDGLRADGIWSVSKEVPEMMGRHLRAQLGDEVVIVPILAAESKGWARAEKLGARSIEAALVKLHVPLFALDLRRAKESLPALHWLSKTCSVRGAEFDWEFCVVPMRAFDGVVFVRRITPADGNTTV